MNTPIATLMSSQVWSVGMDDTVESVEALMARQRISWVPVVESTGATVGVIARSDLLQFHIRMLDPPTVRAWQICTYRPISVDVTASVRDVARLMLERHLHHVVVMQDGRMVGVVSALDFARVFVGEADRDPA
jgi:signal-transduction protein with cAMP-binding, CBS, and nucleotidyltransferase domain